MLHKIREVAKDKCGVFSPKQNVHICRILDKKGDIKEGRALLPWGGPQDMSWAGAWVSQSPLTVQ